MNKTNKILSVVDVAGSIDRWNKYKAQVTNSLPSQFSKESKRYFSIYAQLLQGFLNNPKITDKESILTCMFNAPKLGLNPDPAFGQIYFIPYAGKLTYQIGYKGMIQLSLNSGKVINVRSGLVYENDEWDYYENETGQHYTHRPAFGKKRGKEICGYSIFTDAAGNPNIHVMESEHIDAIKALVCARSKSGPWTDKLFEPEMRKKTVVRRHWKMEPMSAEIAMVIETEEKSESGIVVSDAVNKKMLEDILNDQLPDPNSSEGKALNNELDQLALTTENSEPFK